VRGEQVIRVVSWPLPGQVSPAFFFLQNRRELLLTSRPLAQYRLSIAGIIIHFIADSNLKLLFTESHRQFIVSEGEPDLRLKIHYGPLPPLKLEEKLFDSGVIWALYRSDGIYEMTFKADVFGLTPYQVALIDSRFESGDLYVRVPNSKKVAKSTKPGHDALPCIIPIAYPLDEVFMVNLLARGRGVEIHSCGVNYKGQGMIFTGTSGTGKSTLGRLWKDERDALVLSDERIIVRRIDGRFWMYGTPWYSSAGTSSPEGVPLERIFFIKHSPQNYALPLKAGDAASRLFVRCFPTFWDESCLNYTLGFVGQIAEQVPCYELGFVPDKSVLEFVNKICSGEPLH